MESAAEDLHRDNEALRAELARLVDVIGEQHVTERFARLTGAKLEELDRHAADLLNFAYSHRGFAAQRRAVVQPAARRRPTASGPPGSQT